MGKLILKRLEIINLIENFKKNPLKQDPKYVKKLKRGAMKYNIQLGGVRKLFCQKCYTVFNGKNSEIRINSGVKRIKCLKCSKISRYKIRNV